MVLPTEVVIGVENTRAIVLSWPEDVRQSFTDELRHYLRSHTEVPLTQLTSLTMARVRPISRTQLLEISGRAEHGPPSGRNELW
jgi:hypothetical protein